MHKLAFVSAALLHSAAVAVLFNAPGSDDQAAAAEPSAIGNGEPPTAAPAAEQRSTAAEGGARRDRCLKMHGNLCDPSSGNRAVLVTAHGGSGTTSLSALFKMNGMDLPHEVAGQGGSVSWPFAVDVRNTAFAGHNCLRWPFLAPPLPPETRFRNVYHFVRCPVDVIASAMSWIDWSGDYCAMRYLNATLELGWSGAFHKGDPHFWAKAWLAQNEFIESYAQRTFRLDSFADLFRQVCRDTGLGDGACESATLPTRNKRRHHGVTWADLTARVGAELVGELRSAAVRYGFGEDCLEDAPRIEERPKMIKGRQVVTHGIPGEECGGEPGRECADGVDWVWEASAVERMRRSGQASFRAAWAAV